jgi:hypothetical protein
MKPLPDLPFRVLASLAGILVILLSGIALWPQAGLLLLLAVAGMTAAGGCAVAVEARRRRMDRPESASAPPARSGGSGHGPQTGVSGTVATAVFVGVAVACLAALLAAPGLYVKDAGELASAALVLGVPHPTGFPAFCLLGRAFGTLPAGDAFFRMNLLSAVSLGALAAAAWAVARDVAGAPAGSGSRTLPWAALVAPAALLASPTTWLHGTTTEVYALSAAGMTAAIGCALAGVRRADARWLVLGGFLVGLGAGGHVTWPVEAGFVLAVAAVALTARRPAAWRVLPTALAAMVVGALVVLYLPIAASREPLLNWGDPSTAAGVWEHLTGARIRRSFAGQIGDVSLVRMEANLRMALGTLAEGTLALWPLALAGLVRTARRAPAAAVALLGVLVGDVVFAVRVNPMGINDLQVLVPSTVVLAILSATGVEALAAGARRVQRPSWAPLAVVAGWALVVLQGVMAPADRDKTRVQPREIAATFLEGLPPGATVLTSSDDLSATLLGVQAVDGVRPDVLSLVRQHLSDTPYVTRHLKAHGGRPGEEGLWEALRTMPFEAGGEAPAQALNRAVDLAVLRGPVYIETGDGAVDGAVRDRLVPGFPACALGTIGPAAGVSAALDAAAAAGSQAGGADRWTRAFLAAQVRGLSTLAALRGGEGPAREMLAAALRLDPRDPRAMNNLGALLADDGLPAAALPWLQRAVDEDPSYVRAWQTLSRVAAAAGRPEEAARASARAAALGP